MIKNFIITALRNLRRNKIFSFINVFGLAVGLTCCMLISAYLYKELTYDTYPVNADQIYRVELHSNSGDATADFPNVDIAVGPGIKNAFPEVTDVTRIENRGPVFVKYNETKFKEDKIIDADPNLFSMFSIPMVDGDNKTALTEPNSVVLTKDFERKYFGGASSINKIITVDGKPLKVTGIIDRIPENSHFHADAIVSSSTYISPTRKMTWSNIGYYTYISIRPNTDIKKLEAGFKGLVAEHVVPEIKNDMGVSLAEAQKSVNSFVFFLEPLRDIHLRSATKFELEANGDIHYIYIFGALAFFILLLACINFTNLSTASSTKRSKEIGIRKVLGSEKNKLVTQFLTESVILTAIAMLFALGFIYLLLPYFNNLAGKNITIGFFFGPAALLVEVALILFVGIVAGIYPAFFLSSFKILAVLKGSGTVPSAGKGRLRSSLIVLQFSISTALIIATFVVYQQLHFMQDKKLGYNKDQVLVINDANTLGNNVFAFRQQLLTDSRVVNATVSDNIPGYNRMGGTVVYADGIPAGGKQLPINIYSVESSYIPTMGMQLAKGRNFYPEGSADSVSIILNEAAVRDLGFRDVDPIGKTIIRSGQIHYTVVGVVKDFNYTSAKRKIAPLMMLPLNNSHGSVIVRVKTADVHKLVDDIGSKWASFHSEAPFNYSFLDQQFASLYANEQRTSHIFTSFAVIAVIIASLGLFGLAAFMIRQRVKEIGIRKVLGASPTGITLMLSKEFLRLILIATLVAFPVTWFAMSKWLQDFAYRIDIQWWVFVLAGAIALLVAVITISFQSVKASLANPVKSLRSE
ncbi:MAG: ABC transporter permease [Bacteroidota bacterium]